MLPLTVCRTEYEKRHVNEVKFEKRLHVFGSACHLVASGSDMNNTDPLELAEGEFTRLEAKFASFRPDSVIASINAAAGTGKPTPLDAEARSLFSYVNALWGQSNHVFDPSIRVLLGCYSPEGKLIATPEQLQATLKLVGWSGLEIGSRGALLSQEGMAINLDSCIRPYAVDSVRKILIKAGVTNALIDLDQDVASIGRQPDGANWLVGARHPKGQRTAFTRFKLNDRGYSLRGNFEHRMTIENECYGRALSPVDGQPLPGLLSVAVIADNCLTACSAANIARLKTEKAALLWLEKLGLPWMAVDRQLVCHGPLAPA